MKIVEKSKVIKEIVYEALDGTQFTKQEECVKYENSAKCVLFQKYNKLVLKHTNEDDLYLAGNEENNIDIVQITCAKDIDTIMQLFCLLNAHENYRKEDDRMRKYCEEALLNGSPLIIYRGYYGAEDYFWIRGSVMSITQHILNFCNNEHNNA